MADPLPPFTASHIMVGGTFPAWYRPTVHAAYLPHQPMLGGKALSCQSRLSKYQPNSPNFPQAGKAWQIDHSQSKYHWSVCRKAETQSNALQLGFLKTSHQASYTASRQYWANWGMFCGNTADVIPVLVGPLLLSHQLPTLTIE